MNNIVVFLIAPTGSGKSTILNIFNSKLPNGSVLNIGKHCREKFANMDRSANVTTPEESESFVRDIFSQHISNMRPMIQKTERKATPPVAVVDGLPRSSEQVRFVMDECKRTGSSPIFVYVDTPLTAVYDRLRHRNMGQLTSLDSKRINNDYGQILSVIDTLKSEYGQEIHNLDNLTTKSIMSSVNDLCDWIASVSNK